MVPFYLNLLINSSMAKPVLVIVGRPNVGKSTLFNRIVGSRAAIVEDIPGVTRDRNYMDAEWEGKGFVAVDTGGFYPRHDDNIFQQIKEQALFAMEEADIIIHLLDGREGLNPYDTELVEILRASGKPVIWAVNKIDAPSRESLILDFYPLGVEELMHVSAATGYNFDELMDRAASALPPSEPTALDYPRVAVIGRPNVGKSTMINALLGKRRLLVSPVPGTTRDSIDSICPYYRRKYLLIDTAGIRRKDRLGYSLERFAMLRTMRSIERADVAVIIIDATEGIVTEDQKIAGMVHEKEKGAIFLLNKWDLVEEPDAALKVLTAQMKDKLWFFLHAPVLTTSGTERKRITKLFPLVDGIIKERSKKISTPMLNRFLKGITIAPHKGKKVKLLYVTQVGTEPPRFSIFTNRPEGVRDSDRRHIEARLREKFSFKGTPIKIHIKMKT
jgi:GTP-binding protein